MSTSSIESTPRPASYPYLVLACKLGTVHRFERPTVQAAYTTANRLRVLGYAVSVLRPVGAGR
jgi:hypothetical protein